MRRINLSGWLVFLALLGLWEILGRAHPALRSYLPGIAEIGRSLWEIVISGRVGEHFVRTLGRFAAGYAIAAIVAVAGGVLLGYFRFLHTLFDPVIEILRPMPSVAIIPVAILALGLGDAMIVAVTVYASTWPVLINTIDGVRNIEPTLIQTGATFGLRRGRILTKIVLPAASPYVVTGLRISLAIALILVTTAEMIAAGTGLGFFILDEERSLRTANMYAGIVLVAVLGYGLNRAFSAVEKRLLRWGHRFRAPAGVEA